MAVFAAGLTNLLWTNNAGSGVWSFAPSDTNWNSGPAAAYVEPAAVTFDDTPGADQSLVLSAAVAPQSITFSNNNWGYSLSSSGSGAITGAGSVTLNGSGNVAFNLANSFSGATTINGGALQLGHSNALVNSTAVVNAANGLGFSGGIGTFNLGGLSGSGSFALSDAGGGPVALNVGGNGASTAFLGAIGGNGSLTKAGSGTLTFSGSNNYSGNTTISQGVLAAGGSSVGAGTIYLANGATFRPIPPGLAVNIYTPDPGGTRISRDFGQPTPLQHLGGSDGLHIHQHAGLHGSHQQRHLYGRTFPTWPTARPSAASVIPGPPITPQSSPATSTCRQARPTSRPRATTAACSSSTAPRSSTATATSR